jgi:hypothetical protein
MVQPSARGEFRRQNGEEGLRQLDVDEVAAASCSRRNEGFGLPPPKTQKQHPATAQTQPPAAARATQ